MFDAAHPPGCHNYWKTAYRVELGDAAFCMNAAATYVNFLGEEGSERTRSAYRQDYDRLVALKKVHDPDNFFRLNQNIEQRG